MPEQTPRGRIVSILKRHFDAAKFADWTQFQFVKWCEAEPDRIVEEIYDTKLIIREPDKLDERATVEVTNGGMMSYKVEGSLRVGDKFVWFGQQIPAHLIDNDDVLRSMSRAMTETALREAMQGLEEDVYVQVRSCLETHRQINAASERV